MAIEIDNSWDIEKYKRPYEMDHQWELRKKFILAHKNSYSEERLICLAQLFVNVHFLGCRYDDDTMELVESLSKVVVEKNDKWNRQSFVTASVALDAKYKGRSSNEQQPSTSKGPINFVKSDPKNFEGNLSSSNSYMNEPHQRPQTSWRGRGDVWVRGHKRANHSGLGYEDRSVKMPRLEQSVPPPSIQHRTKNTYTTSNKYFSIENKRNQSVIQNVVDSGPFGKVVVFQSGIGKEESPISVIERTANAAHSVLSFNFTPQEKQNTIMCKLSLDGLYLASGEDKSQKLAKEAACKVAIKRLQETSFTIVVKASFIGSEQVSRDGEANNGYKTNESVANVDKPISDSNIGNKLLKLMGWTGGGLGKNEQGIEEPIKPTDSLIRRGGLGIENFYDFKRKMLRILEDFAHSDSKEDLVFSSEFTKDERKAIHELVRKYNLKSRSYGKEEDNRRIVVFKKIRPLEIVEDLMNCGGETDKYKLIEPNSLRPNENENPF